MHPDETFNNSSIHRIARAKAAPPPLSDPEPWHANPKLTSPVPLQAMPVPTTAEDIRAVLGDQNDTQYPIFHDELVFLPVGAAVPSVGVPVGVVVAETAALARRASYLASRRASAASLHVAGFQPAPLVARVALSRRRMQAARC